MSEAKKIHLFVPGRLCLFGEHSDWAGMYRSVNSGLSTGQAIVSGVEQGIYATAEKSDRFIMTTVPGFPEEEFWECEMDSAKLLSTANQGGFFSYVAGVASYVNDNYRVGGLKITIEKRDLPLKSGLSSSAAICVLVARAFNLLYHLQMNIKGEMQAAFRGEQRTPSRCGRLDQACAYGVKPVWMEFDGLEIHSRELRVGTTFHWVIANLMASKNTIKILADLNKAYPFAENEREKEVQDALGPVNQSIIRRARECLEKGEVQNVGLLMSEAQDIFDQKIAPMCSELKAPVLHSVLNDPQIKALTYGGKGVGSQGDGTVQFLAKDAKSASALQKYLLDERGMPSFSLTLKPGQAIRRAIIPLAGFGTRIFPATKCFPKCFLPILDTDGLLKPALLIMLEQLLDAGIEEICLIIGEEEQKDFDRFFSSLPDDLLEKLPEGKQAYDDQIRSIKDHITFVYQNERKGFGHAIWLAREFTENEPVLLLLGDFLYRTNSTTNCCAQVMEAYKDCGCTMVSITEVPLNKVAHYGILHGYWTSTDETVMKVDRIVEKPTDDYAQEYLSVRNGRGEYKYYATFGQYVLTSEVFFELDHQIRVVGTPTEGTEYGLTAALDRVREKSGLYAYVPDGESFDIGLPDSYRETMWNFANNPHNQQRGVLP